ncbi:helix-turn-helix domain-containing protein [Flagellimonas crocea]|uniref:helix-turn-helix domain-containing protein n=1 Tax=Flagellimonas crocea TaxID=3067311 RepID=UPI00296F2DD9|nr:helix-turn-helix transcriptional regulator [Muricauda sp. DH64]
MDLLRIREILNEKNVTGKKLASAVGVTPASISNILNGTHFPKAELLVAIAKELEVEVRDLFHGKKGNEQPYGYIEYKGEIHKVASIDDYKRLSSMMD